MRVLVAEKPSVARELAAVVGARQRRTGYFEGAGHQVTWALGHLATLKEPEDYNPAWRRWSLHDLPIVPDRFELKPRDDDGARAQFAIVARLLRAADEIVAATDAGREGELIFRYILELAGLAHRPFQRLWLSALTPAAIRQGLAHLRPGGDFDTLAAAARARGEADWIVGLNATRNFTVRLGRQGLPWSVGRVQTPVLALIARRDDEIAAFTPRTFWELLTRYREATFRHVPTDAPSDQAEGGRFFDEAAARALLARVQGHELFIRRVDRKPERVPPPLLFDLTELQREMNRRFGLTAAATLQAAQTLYERKLITYPRTDSRHLPNSLRGEAAKILARLAASRPAEIGKLNLAALPTPGRVFNDAKVSDHHAIIPTGDPPGGLGGAAQRVFDAVATRFIAAFYPACEKEATVVNADAAGVPFRARGVRVLVAGWTELYPPPAAKPPRGAANSPNANTPDDGFPDSTSPDSDADAAPPGEEAVPDASAPLPEFRVGEHGPHQPRLRQGETKPPPRFTENSLLGAMETAGRLVDEEELREALKEKGLGTPATRAAMIETLLRREYIERRGKQLVATDAGRYLIAMLPEPTLKSPELTGQWEAKLRAIEQGRADAGQFRLEIVAYLRRLLEASSQTEVDPLRWGECPRCGQPILEGRTGFGCSAWKGGCSFVLWKTHRGRAFSNDEVRELLQRRVLARPVELEGLGPRVLYLGAQGQVLEVAPPGARGPRIEPDAPPARDAPDDDASPATKPKLRRGAQGARAKKKAAKNASTGQRGKTSSRRKGPAARRAADNLAAILEQQRDAGEHDGGEHGGSAPRPPEAPASLGACPLCGAAVVDQPKSYGCSAWREGCKFAIWKTIAGKKISAAAAKTLLRGQTTAPLKGFRSKQGKAFSARLKLANGAVVFEFGDGE